LSLHAALPICPPLHPHCGAVGSGSRGGAAMPVRVVFRHLLRRREMDSGQACERQGPPQLREDRTAQGGWALFAVIALLGVLAVVAGALLRLAPSSLRLSLTQLDRV